MPCDGFSCKRGIENPYARDNAARGDTILPINAFWNSFETFLGPLCATANAIFR
jgi:hypothetical protein